MADISAAMKDWSATSSSNSPGGSTNIGTGLDDNLKEIQGSVVRNLHNKGADIASAGTTDLGAVEGLMHDITGTTTITSFGTVRAGVWKVIKFEGVLTLTHNATSLILPGAANITTADGDIAIVFSEGSGNWRCVSYFSAASGIIGTTSTAILKGLLDISASAAGQIKFPATQNPSADVNTFDDYEEGTFTPAINFGGGSTGLTYSVQTGIYTKVGNVVNYVLAIRLTNKGSSTGNAQITGLPFTVRNVSDVNVPIVCEGSNFGATVNSLMGTAVINTSTINPSKFASGASTQLAETDFANNTILRISGSYFV